MNRRQFLLAALGAPLVPATADKPSIQTSQLPRVWLETYKVTEQGNVVLTRVAWFEPNTWPSYTPQTPRDEGYIRTSASYVKMKDGTLFVTLTDEQLTRSLS